MKSTYFFVVIVHRISWFRYFLCWFSSKTSKTCLQHTALYDRP